MGIVLKKVKWVPLTFIKMVVVAVITNLFGIGWGLMAIAIIDSLPSIKINIS